MRLADLLRGIGDLPFEEALPKQVEILRGSILVLPVVEPPGDQQTQTDFLTGKDAEGRSWLYAYTSGERMAEAGLVETQQAHFRFEDVVDMGYRNGLGGIVIDNHDVEAVVHIPDYCLESLSNYLKE